MIQKIKCPVCGYEYVVSEIFIPKYLLGNPKLIERDNEGKIDVYVGDEQDLVEEYTCDNCSTAFKVRANITFDVEVLENKTFNDEYITEIYTDRLTLKE